MEQPPKRSCGDCRACCTIMGVDELQKKLYTRCEHVGMFGCTIYETRPPSCQGFECLWLQGIIDADDHADLLRPDKIKVMFEFQADTKFGPVFKAWEVEPGAADRPAAKTIIETIAAQHLLLIMGEKRRTIVGPKEDVKRAERVVAAHGLTSHRIQGDD